MERRLQFSYAMQLCLMPRIELSLNEPMIDVCTKSTWNLNSSQHTARWKAQHIHQIFMLMRSARLAASGFWCRVPSNAHEWATEINLSNANSDPVSNHRSWTVQLFNYVIEAFCVYPCGGGVPPSAVIINCDERCIRIASCASDWADEYRKWVSTANAF